MTERIALFPLGAVLFPGRLLPLHIFEPRYRALVEHLLEPGTDNDRRGFGVVGIRVGRETGLTGAHALHSVGTFARLRAVQAHDDGRYDLVAQGSSRFRSHRLVTGTAPYLEADVEWLAEEDGDLATERADLVRPLFAEYCAALGIDPAVPGAVSPAEGRDDEGDAVRRPEGNVNLSPGDLSYQVAAGMVITPQDQQALLEAQDTAARLTDEVRLLRRELALWTTLSSVPDVSATRVPIALN